jgi:hypothetical protein
VVAGRPGAPVVVGQDIRQVRVVGASKVGRSAHHAMR